MRSFSLLVSISIIFFLLFSCLFHAENVRFSQRMAQSMCDCVRVFFRIRFLTGPTHTHTHTHLSALAHSQCYCCYCWMFFKVREREKEKALKFPKCFLSAFKLPKQLHLQSDSSMLTCAQHFYYRVSMTMTMESEKHSFSLSFSLSRELLFFSASFSYVLHSLLHFMRYVVLFSTFIRVYSVSVCLCGCGHLSV